MEVKPTREQAEEAVRTLIAYLGDDPNRPGVLDTPGRFLRAWEEDWGRGYTDPEPVMRAFPSEGYKFSQLVIVRDIAFHSHCEHHLAPFSGVAHVCYFPDAEKGVVGLSKFARVIDHFARRLQVQERMTEQIADYLAEHASRSCGVIMRATHGCMVSRGVLQANALTVTSAIRGDLINDEAARAEFLKLAG